MQGGIDPDLPGTAYFDLARAVKAAAPGMHVHAFSPDGDRQRRGPDRAVVAGLARGAKDAGLDSIPGTAAEILDDEVRWVLTKGKLPAAQLGRGRRHRARARHPEQRHDDVRPRRHTRATGWATCACWPGSRTETGGFTEFVPLPFVHTNAPVYLAGVARPGPDAARQPRGARGGAADAARPDRQHPDVLGQARRRRHPGDAPGRRQRRRRHPDGGDDQPDGRVGSTARPRPWPS